MFHSVQLRSATSAKLNFIRLPFICRKTMFRKHFFIASNIKYDKKNQQHCSTEIEGKLKGIEWNGKPMK